MLCAKLQHMCGVVVDEGNGVEKWHGKSFWKGALTLGASRSVVCGLRHA
jgi:hypothetical protein